jgi:hypothetical protein
VLEASALMQWKNEKVDLISELKILGEFEAWFQVAYLIYYLSNLKQAILLH